MNKQVQFSLLLFWIFNQWRFPVWKTSLWNSYICVMSSHRKVVGNMWAGPGRGNTMHMSSGPHNIKLEATNCFCFFLAYGPKPSLSLVCRSIHECSGCGIGMWLLGGWYTVAALETVLSVHYETVMCCYLNVNLLAKNSDIVLIPEVFDSIWKRVFDNTPIKVWFSYLCTCNL